MFDTVTFVVVVVIPLLCFGLSTYNLGYRIGFDDGKEQGK